MLRRAYTAPLVNGVIARAQRARGNPFSSSLRPPCLKGGWHGEAVTGGFFPCTHGRAHGPCPTKILHTHIGRTGSSAPTSISVGATRAVARPTAHLVPVRRGRRPRRPEPGLHRSSCDVSLRDQRARWSWQSVPLVPKAPLPKGSWHGEAVTGRFFPRTHGRAHGPCPTKILRTHIGRTGSSAPTKSYR